MNKPYTDDKRLYYFFTGLNIASFGLYFLFNGQITAFLTIPFVICFCLLLWSIVLFIQENAFITDSYESQYSLISTVNPTIRIIFHLIISICWSLAGFGFIGIIYFIYSTWSALLYDSKLKYHKAQGWLTDDTKV